jgi:hypothetical protein
MSLAPDMGNRRIEFTFSLRFEWQSIWQSTASFSLCDGAILLAAEQVLAEKERTADFRDSVAAMSYQLLSISLCIFVNVFNWWFYSPICK